MNEVEEAIVEVMVAVDEANVEEAISVMSEVKVVEVDESQRDVVEERIVIWVERSDS